jgi:hypothetical protein
MAGGRHWLFSYLFFLTVRKTPKLSMKFLIDMISGEGGVSSKRSVMVWFVFLFTYLVIRDTEAGGLKHPQQCFSDQVFWLVITSLTLVFGEKFIPVLLQIMQKKSQPNIQTPEK